MRSRTGKIDAFFWVGGMPTAAVTDLATTRRHQDEADRPRRPRRQMNKKYGKLYSKSRIKAGTYPGYKDRCDVAEVWNLIVTGDA